MKKLSSDSNDGVIIGVRRTVGHFADSRWDIYKSLNLAITVVLIVQIMLFFNILFYVKNKSVCQELSNVPRSI